MDASTPVGLQGVDAAQDREDEHGGAVAAIGRDALFIRITQGGLGDLVEFLAALAASEQDQLAGPKP